MTDRKTEDPQTIGQTPLSAVPTVAGRADDPLTDKQAAILGDLADRAGEPFDGNLTRGQAEARIEALRDQLGEG